MQAALSHYDILEQIGAGGMGVVYRAHDERLDRDVALKVLPPGSLADEGARKRFRKEALALSKLNHPNIAVVHDFDTWDGTDFLVEELILGLSLDEMLISGPLPEREVISLGSQLVEGLAAAHEQGVIHRDLKPANIRVTPDGRLKILDFGLARIAQPSIPTALTATETQTPDFAGTLPYMAPEQLLGEQAHNCTDIWAAGCVLYEMATGRRPFLGSGPALIDAILHQAPPAASKFNPKVTPALEAILSKCLDKAPQRRYHSAREIAVDLRRLTSEPMSAGMRLRFRGWFAALAVAATAAVLAVVAAGVWYEHVQRNARPVIAASIAVLPFADLSPGHDQEYFSDGLAEEILNDLTKVPSLKVVARTSAFQFKGKNEDLRVIGHKLNVENILEGSVRREGTRVRITAQLVKVDDGFHLWSESYDRDFTGIFTVQDDIAKAVTSSLKLKLLAGKSSLSASRTANPEAYQDFLQARYFTHMGDKESTQKAFGYINRAIQSDARYAAAYALRARLSLSSGLVAWMDYSEAIEKARRDAEKAIELDPDLPDGYRVLSQIQATGESNCRAGEMTLRRARELAPTDADNLGESGLFARCLGHQEEAIELLKQALALDPLQAGRYLQLAQNLRDLGRYEESQVALGKAVDLYPHHVWVHETRGEVYLAQGRPQKALTEMEKEPAGFLRDFGMALAYHALGRNQESDAALAILISQCPNNCAYQIAQVYAYRGKVDEAFEWLNRAHRQHDGGLILIKTDLLLRGLRGDPRYAQMLKRLNLPD